MAQCQYIKPDGDQCGANAVTGSDYCRHHPPDEESEKAVEAEGKRLIDGAESVAVETLLDVAKNGRGPGARTTASAELLEHVRWREGQE